MANLFGESLRRHREAAGLTQHALAERADIDQSYITRLENGSRQPPDRDKVAKLADALDLDDVSRYRFFVAAGHVPDWLLALDPADPTLLAIARYLSAPTIADAAKRDLRQAVALLVARWRTDDGPPA